MRGTRLVRLFGLMVTAAAVLVANPAVAGSRVVAIGDVHGAYDEFVSILQRVELIDDEGHWIGGTSTLVQVGDLFDRGVQVRPVLDLLMRLQTEAAGAGGEVIVLLGNHEGMVLTGFYRDINPEMYATFADEKSEKRRKAAFRQYQKYWRDSAAAVGKVAAPMSKDVKQQWMTAHPLGRVELTEAIGPDGVYGKWLRTLPVAAVIDDVLFIHGGIGPKLAGMSVAAINQKAASEMEIYDRTRAYMLRHGMFPSTLGIGAMLAIAAKKDPPDPGLAELMEADSWLIRSGEGPLWFRGAAKWDEYEKKAEMDTLLDGLGVSYVVGGHTPQRPRRIQTRFDNRVFLIDTGMLAERYEGGQPAALVIEGGTFTAVYLDSSEVLVEAEQLADAA